MPPSLSDVDLPLRTDRLTLRRGLPDDAEAVFAYRSLEPVARWLTQIQTDPRAWAAEWELRLATTLVVEYGGRPIGDTRIVVQDAYSQAEVAPLASGVEAELMWAFDPAFHGRGYATEAVRALIGIAFEQLGLRRLLANCYADNEGSWRLMERVGMRREAHSVASTLHRDGTWHDFLAYALLSPTR